MTVFKVEKAVFHIKGDLDCHIVMSRCIFIHSRLSAIVGKFGLVDHMMCSFYKKHSHSIHSTISDILSKGVNSVAQWLEHWVSVSGVL